MSGEKGQKILKSGDHFVITIANEDSFLFLLDYSLYCKNGLLPSLALKLGI